MRYGLLNDVRVLDKAAFPLMVQRYVALAYDKGRIQRADDLPQPLLWQLQVNDAEIAETAAAFNLTDSRPIVGFCPGAEFGPAKRWPHYHYATLAQKLIESGYQIALFGSAKDHEAGEQIRAALQEDARDFCLNRRKNPAGAGGDPDRGLPGSGQQRLRFNARCRSVEQTADSLVRPKQPRLHAAALRQGAGDSLDQRLPQGA